jgi:hypothetical protein
MVNWKEFAKINNMTPEEFEKEIYCCAAYLGAMQVDHEDCVALRFTCSDDVGKIALIVKRID